MAVSAKEMSAVAGVFFIIGVFAIVAAIWVQLGATIGLVALGMSFILFAGIFGHEANKREEKEKKERSVGLEPKV